MSGGTKVTGEYCPPGHFVGGQYSLVHRNNGFLEQVCVWGTDAAVWARRTSRVQTAFRTLSLRQTRLRCKSKDQFKMYIGILCIFATSGGVHALT